MDTDIIGTIASHLPKSKRVCFGKELMAEANAQAEKRRLNKVEALTQKIKDLSPVRNKFKELLTTLNQNLGPNYWEYCEQSWDEPCSWHQMPDNIFSSWLRCWKQEEDDEDMNFVCPTITSDMVNKMRTVFPGLSWTRTRKFDSEVTCTCRNEESGLEYELHVVETFYSNDCTERMAQSRGFKFVMISPDVGSVEIVIDVGNEAYKPNKVNLFVKLYGCGWIEMDVVAFVKMCLGNALGCLGNAPGYSGANERRMSLARSNLVLASH